ncbi:MAG: lytic murein transglycosylase [Alphaproteobacteria bacterium]|nr:lytic murein transglycosylase [Alphaproteobacteria bacterium]
MKRRVTLAASLSGAMLMAASVAAEATTTCTNSGDFSAWKRDFRGKVVAAGITPQTIRRTYDPASFQANIISRDRRQSFFSLTFVDFSKRLVSSHRLRTGAKKLKERAAEFRRAEKQYGVPGEVITAFWALESDFGAGTSKQSEIFDSLITLAYDCRRPELFQDQLIAAMKIIDRGYLDPSRMVGSWAGELGQTQFLPTHYLNFGVDADGNGRRDLIRDDADIIHSTANYIRHLGWSAGEPWLEEVTLPASMPWHEADLAIRHSKSRFGEWGVRDRNGSALRGNAKVALLLPMGRNGPAFIAYRNFDIYPQWNQSLNYAMTAAYLATRLAGAPPYREGRGPIENFGYKETLELQRLLSRRGFDTGGVDGKLGEKSRAAVKAAQIKFGLPADSYPSEDLMSRLR